MSTLARKDAVGHLTVSISREIHEFCIGDAERSKAFAEARDAFHALGVTDQEMDWDAVSGSF